MATKARKRAGVVKRRGAGLEMKTFRGSDDQNILVFRAPTGAYHTFVEIEAKDAARQCGARETKQSTPRTMWKELWDKPPRLKIVD